jgi:acetyl-CoA acyltransferase
MTTLTPQQIAERCAEVMWPDDKAAQGLGIEEAFICDAVRTPIGRYGGALSSVRADDLAALPIRALIDRNAGVNWSLVDDVIYGCANQAGEDNRNVARMAGLLAGLPVDVAGITVNRLCASGMDAIGTGRPLDQGRRGRTDDCRRRREHVARAVRNAQGRCRLLAQHRHVRHDHRLALRQSAAEAQLHGTHSMAQTADNVAAEFGIAAADQDAFALRSQQRWGAAQRSRALCRRDRSRDACHRRKAAPTSSTPTSIRART